VEDGVFAWERSLLSNTTVREVIEASPRDDKHIFIVENYPRKIDRLPSDMMEVEDRSKDIIFGDKTMHTLKMTRLITRQIQLIENLYDIFERSDQFQSDTSEIRIMKKEYSDLIHNYGAEIHSVIRIIRNRIESPDVSKNADFSPKTIKRLILEGEKKTIESIRQFKEKPRDE
jgi:NTE family protein